MSDQTVENVSVPALPPVPEGLDNQISLIPCEWANLCESSKMPVLAGIFSTFTSTMHSPAGLTGMLLSRHKLLIRLQKTQPGTAEVVVFSSNLL